MQRERAWGHAVHKSRLLQNSARRQTHAASCLLLTAFFFTVFHAYTSHIHGQVWPQNRCSRQEQIELWLDDLADEYNAKKHHTSLLQEQIEILLNSTAGGIAAWASHHSVSESTTRPTPFLFVAVLTTPASSRRAAVRATWMQEAPAHNVLAKFILTDEERTPETEEESLAHGDIVFVRRGSGTGYRSIVYKIFLFLEWMVANVDPKFVLKTDDDAYVNCKQTVAELRRLCLSPDCNNERLYLGMEKRNGEVIIEEGHKWSNTEYFRLTGLKEYAPYMLGGGYLFSADVARALVGANAIAPLKFMPNEDATFGFWVMGLNLRRIDHPKAKTAAGHCCYSSVRTADAAGRWRDLKVRTFDPMCAGWLILHKVDNDDQMRYIHERLKLCGEQAELRARANALALAAGAPAPQLVAPLDVFALTSWHSGYHFFGRSDRQQWSPDGTMLLAHRTRATPHNATFEDAMEIGLIPFAAGQPLTQERSGWQWVPLDVSRAWNFQVGASLQWLGSSSRYLAFNDRRCVPSFGPDDLCSVIYDVIARKRARVLPRPICTVSPDGTAAASVNFVRLQAVQPGHGYRAGLAELAAESERKAPADDGLWLMDTRTGDSRLLVSLRQLADKVAALARAGVTAESGSLRDYELTRRMREPATTRCLHWVERPQFNPEGTSIAFLYRVGACPLFPDGGFQSFVFTVEVATGRLWHPPGMEGEQLSFGTGGRLLVCDHNGFHLALNGINVTELRPPANVPASGAASCALHPTDPRFVALDTPAAPHRLLVWDIVRNDSLALGYFGPRGWDGPPAARGTLQPRWSPDGLYISFDSAHVWGARMQNFVAGVQLLKVGWRDLPAASGGPVLDQGAPMLKPPWALAQLAAGSARRADGREGRQGRVVLLALSPHSLGEVAEFLRQAGNASAYNVHMFQMGSTPLAERQALLAILREAGARREHIALHDEAAHTENATGVLISTAANTRHDVDIRYVEALLLSRGPEDGWAVQTGWDGLWAPWRGSTPQPHAANGTGGGHEVLLEGLDFSAWLGRALQPHDRMVCFMDVAGREYGLLAHLLRSGGLAALGQLRVTWHIQHLTWEWPRFWEGIFATIGLDYESRAAEGGWLPVELPQPRSAAGDGGEKAGDAVAAAGGSGDGRMAAGEAGESDGDGTHTSAEESVLQDQVSASETAAAGTGGAAAAGDTMQAHSGGERDRMRVTIRRGSDGDIRAASQQGGSEAWNTWDDGQKSGGFGGAGGDGRSKRASGRTADDAGAKVLGRVSAHIVLDKN